MCLAIPGKVLSISGDEPLTRMGRIDFSGVVKQASLAYVPEVQIGDYVIVHVGFALSKVDEAEAQKVFEYLKQMDELGELEEEVAMKFLDEYRDADLARKFAREIHRVTTKPWKIMEVCGGQTHAIVKFGIDELLPDQIELIHGPGCPVCVTPLEVIDQALEIAARPEVIFTSFGDMLRVPGSTTDLLSVKANGGDVRIVYSPLDAVKIAEQNPAREVVFFGVGFETTAPATAMAVYQAAQKGLQNFSLLISHVLVPPAIEALMSAPDCRVQAFLAAGHVCAVMGYEEYFPLAQKYRVPIVVTGFEPLDILHGILLTVQQLESGRAEVENQYARAVSRAGNQPAQALIKKVFRVVPRKWRGIGEIPDSGLGLADDYAAFDAARRFSLTNRHVDEPAACIAGMILQGLKKPHECPAFGNQCNPEHPLGATMVSSEGACAAYYRYRRHNGVKPEGTFNIERRINSSLSVEC